MMKVEPAGRSRLSTAIGVIAGRARFTWRTDATFRLSEGKVKGYLKERFVDLLSQGDD
jgi:hypothetical protein